MDRREMARLVAEWDTAVVAATDATDWWDATEVSPRPSMLHEPAEPGAIEALEGRIGRRLPPSYRLFLEISDGADASYEMVDEPGGGFFAAAGVGWLVDQARHLPIFAGELPDGWSQKGFDARPTELDWLLTAFVEGAVSGMRGHLPHCLAVSPLQEKSAVLLNPLVRDVDGEWQCIDFYTHDAPTAYRSFAAFLTNRIVVLRELAARVERLDDDDLATVDDATIERWLTSYGVAPPWFTRAAGSEHPPGRVVDVMAGLVESRLGAVSAMACRARGDAAWTLTQAAWRSVEAAEATGRAAGAPLGKDALGLLAELASARDDRVRDWVVDVLVENAGRPVDDRVAAQLGLLAPSAVEELRRNPGAEPLVSAMVAAGQWRGPDDVVALARSQAAEVLDPTWRAEHSMQLHSALDAVARGGAEMAPTLRQLREVADVPQDGVAAALFAVGDDDLGFLARHLSLQAAGQVKAAPPDLRREHRVRRVAALRARADLTVGEAIELGDAGLEEEAAHALLARVAAERPGSVVGALEFRRTVAAADALVSASGDDPHALRSLARLGDERCAAGLLALLDSDDTEARRFAARGLRELGEPTSVARMVAAVVDDADDAVAWIAAHTAVVARVDATRLLERLAATGEKGAQMVAHWRALQVADAVAPGPAPS